MILPKLIPPIPTHRKCTIPIQYREPWIIQHEIWCGRHQNNSRGLCTFSMHLTTLVRLMTISADPRIQNALQTGPISRIEQLDTKFFL